MNIIFQDAYSHYLAVLCEKSPLQKMAKGKLAIV